MSKLKQLIALQVSNLSVRAIARALGLSVGAIFTERTDYRARILPFVKLAKELKP